MYIYGIYCAFIGTYIPNIITVLRSFCDARLQQQHFVCSTRDKSKTTWLVYDDYTGDDGDDCDDDIATQIYALCARDQVHRYSYVWFRAGTG